MREEGEQKPRLPWAVELVGGRMEAMSVDNSLYNDGLEGKENQKDVDSRCPGILFSFA